MEHQMYTVYDEKSKAYLQPFFSQSDGTAIRAITDCVYNRDHVFSKHPADFTLFHLGSYDDSNSSFKLLPAPAVLATLIELVPDALPIEAAIEKAMDQKGFDEKVSVEHPVDNPHPGDIKNAN